MNSLISALALIAGLALLASGGALYFRQRARLARASTVEDEVVELLRSRQAGKYLVSKTAGRRKLSPKYHYRPVIRFKTEHGRSVTFQAAVASRDNRARNPDRPQPYAGQLSDPMSPSTSASLPRRNAFSTSFWASSRARA